MRKLIVIIVLLAVQTAYAESFRSVDVSNKSLNMFICDQDVTGAFYSDKSGLKADSKGNRFFLEFPVQEVKTDELTTRNYIKDPVELVLYCGETVHSLRLLPKNISGALITLSDADVSRQVVQFVSGLKHEEIIVKLAAMILSGDIKSGFNKEDVSIPGKSSKVATIKRDAGDLDVVYRRTITGGGYVVRELYIYTPKEVTLLDTELLSLPWVKAPLGVVLMDSTFIGWTRGLVIEREEVKR